MSPSWKFFGGVIVGLLVLLGVNVAAFYGVLGVPTVNSRWAFEINEKKQMLASQSVSSKLLVVGGSSALFGIKAQQLEKQTGMRTINLATHAALGLHQILREAKTCAKTGDTILLVLEYELYSSGKIGISRVEQEEIDYMLSREPGFLRDLSVLQRWNVLMATPVKRLKIGIKNRFDPSRYRDASGTGLYSLRNIDAWGDQINHPGPSRLGAINSKAILGYTFADHLGCLPDIERFCDWARANGVSVAATFPNLLDDPLYHTAQAKEGIEIIKHFFERLGVPVIGEYTDALLPADQFYDTIYHLTEEAAVVRTQKLAEKLQVCLRQK